jgi:hypothetical protein
MPGHGEFVDQGVKPHWVHRSMVSPSGAKAGTWMDAKGIKGDYMLVGGPNSRIKKPGTRFVSHSLKDTRKFARRRIKQVARRMVK